MTMPTWIEQDTISTSSTTSTVSSMSSSRDDSSAPPMNHPKTIGGSSSSTSIATSSQPPKMKSKSAAKKKNKFQVDIPNAIQDVRREARKLPADFALGTYDIGCGRGQRYCNHSGNQRFRSIVNDHVDNYLQARTKLAKTALIVSILEQVRNKDGEGRFVKQQDDGSWIELGDAASRDKVSNALRSAVAMQKGDAEESSSTGADSSTDALKKKKATKSLKATPITGATSIHAPVKLSNLSLPSSHGAAPVISNCADDRTHVIAALEKYHQLLSKVNSSTESAVPVLPTKKMKTGATTFVPTQKCDESQWKRAKKTKKFTALSRTEQTTSPAVQPVLIRDGSMTDQDAITPPPSVMTSITGTSAFGAPILPLALPSHSVVTPHVEERPLITLQQNDMILQDLGAVTALLQLKSGVALSA